MTRVLAAAIIVLSPLTAQAEHGPLEGFIPAFYYMEDGWTTVLDQNEQGTDLCLAKTVTSEEITFGVVVFPDEYPMLFVDHIEWNFDEHGSDVVGHIYLDIDGQHSWVLNAWFESFAIGSELRPDNHVREIIRDLSAGQIMLVETDLLGAMADVSLTGSAGAFRALSECAARIGGYSDF